MIVVEGRAVFDLSLAHNERKGCWNPVAGPIEKNYHPKIEFFLTHGRTR